LWRALSGSCAMSCAGNPLFFLCKFYVLRLMAFRPSMYDDLTNHERYWLLRRLVTDTLHKAHEDYAAGNAHKKFAAFTRELQAEIARFWNQNEKAITTEYKNLPRRVEEQFPEQAYG
jgi:hypothetical protein